MFYCNDCDNTFSEPATESQSVPYGMGGASFNYAVCPYCKSENFDEAEFCRECEEVLTEENNFGGLCKECITEDMNLALTMFDFCQDTACTKDMVNDFAVKCLGYDGINDILRKYFLDICEKDFNCFEKERKEFIDKYTQEIGEWIVTKDKENEKT